MRNLSQKQKPCGIIIVKQIQPHEWIFDYPRLTMEVNDLLHNAIDGMRSDARTAKAQFRRLIKDYPEFLDAYHHLALTWHWEGKLDKAGEVWRQGIEFALKLFPAHFSMKEDRLEWGFVENRPFLRIYHGHGLSLLRQGETEKAREVFENLVALNPNDNQGVRALLVECGFELQRPEDVLKVCNQYPGDGLEQTLYGRVLALIQLGKDQEAAPALKLAIKCLPLVAKELTKTTHRQPPDYSEERVGIGSEGQAFGYWKKCGKHWSATPGAVEFVRRHLEGGRRLR